MRFEFATAGRVIFGAGVLREVGGIAAEHGRRALIVTGSGMDHAATLKNLLAEAGLSSTTFSVHEEPSIEIVRACMQQAHRESCDLIIGIGGGSALDTGKAAAALLTNGDDPLDFLEVIGRGKPLTEPPVPYIALPTTAGTGSEVTRNAVLASPEHRVKVSLRSPLMLPRIALVDPELTYSMPPSLTASTGLDALTQLIEPFVSRRANPLTDALCREGMQRAGRSLRRAYHHGEDPTAREDMALASLFGGFALANAGLGAAHGFAGPFGGMFHAPHGAICAALLPHVMAINLRALGEREPEGETLTRFGEVARILTGVPAATAEEGVAWVHALCEELQVPPLGSYGLARSGFADLIEKAGVASSMRANPIQLTTEEMREVLELAL